MIAAAGAVIGGMLMRWYVQSQSRPTWMVIDIPAEEPKKEDPGESV